MYFLILIEMCWKTVKGDENDQLVPISPRDEMLVIQVSGIFLLYSRIVDQKDIKLTGGTLLNTRF